MADVGRTFRTDDENKYVHVYRICWGKPVKSGHLDNRIDGIAHDTMEKIVRTRRQRGVTLLEASNFRVPLPDLGK